MEHVCSSGRILCSQVSGISREFDGESLQKLSVGKGEAPSFARLGLQMTAAFKDWGARAGSVWSRQEREMGGSGFLPTDPRKSLTQTPI